MTARLCIYCGTRRARRWRRDCNSCHARTLHMTAGAPIKDMRDTTLEVALREWRDAAKALNLCHPQLQSLAHSHALGRFNRAEHRLKQLAEQLGD